MFLPRRIGSSRLLFLYMSVYLVLSFMGAVVVRFSSLKYEALDGQREESGKLLTYQRRNEFRISCTYPFN